MKDIVLIRADKQPEQTKSGFYIQEEWKTLPPTGEILAIGPDVTDLSVGDRVVFERYGSIILPDNERLCKQTHILAKLHETSEAN